MTTHEKHPDERRRYDFDFSKFAEIQAGQTITAVESVTAMRRAGSGAVVTLETPYGISGARAQVVISGGSAGDDYILTVIVTTSTGLVLAACGRLLVKEVVGES